ncbi:hypothetical protein F7D01_07855 [Erythrobacter sp. 3-20A1M]|uniref:hypothetical protein n=1 Tax=Erythrobacter sp. 3-20A1M TaxID=2653850 RepID=UPI001BFC3AF1|nr:hypothetical protein [Erythrobacter sp. 3-20A1M]QWC57015.1 hypothetical protein F7D01_07855 [Erythrobacter sp. 3-20A1M]
MTLVDLIIASEGLSHVLTVAILMAVIAGATVLCVRGLRLSQPAGDLAAFLSAGFALGLALILLFELASEKALGPPETLAMVAGGLSFAACLGLDPSKWLTRNRMPNEGPTDRQYGWRKNFRTAALALAGGIIFGTAALASRDVELKIAIGLAMAWAVLWLGLPDTSATRIGARGKLDLNFAVASILFLGGALGTYSLLELLPTEVVPALFAFEAGFLLVGAFGLVVPTKSAAAPRVGRGLAVLIASLAGLILLAEGLEAVLSPEASNSLGHPSPSVTAEVVTFFRMKTI